MHAAKTETVSQDYREDVDRAVQILTEGGCSEVFLFGSVPQGTTHGASDIDIAVRGCPKDRFFGLLGDLLVELEHPVDLVDLDEDNGFATRLVTEGRLVRVAGKV